MSDRLRVCKIDELPAGERMLLSVDGVEIGVFNLDGELFALQNVCCHQHGPVCEGKVQPSIDARYETPGERVDEFFGDTWTIACPWHGWEYDIRTGHHIGEEDISIPTFEVLVEGDTVFIEY